MMGSYMCWSPMVHGENLLLALDKQYVGLSDLLTSKIWNGDMVFWDKGLSPRSPSSRESRGPRGLIKRVA